MKIKLEFEFKKDEMDKFRECANWENASIALWNIQQLGYKAREEKWCSCRWIREINTVLKTYEVLEDDDLPKKWECDCV